MPTYANDGFGRADLHTHTLASDGLMAARDLVDRVERNTSLDVIAITDHDETAAALDARDWAAQRGYLRPGGARRRGDHPRRSSAGALFIEDRPPGTLRRLLPTAEWVVNHGGLCIAPHPFTRLTHSLDTAALCPGEWPWAPGSPVSKS